MRINSIINCAVKSTDAWFATKCHNICTATIILIKIPVFMWPHLSTLSNTYLRLINYKGNAFICSQLSKLLIVSRGSLSVFHSSNWLNNDCSNCSVLCLLRHNNLFCCFNTPLLLSSIFMWIMWVWVLYLWKWCNWPVISRCMAPVWLVRAAETGNWVTVATTWKTQNCKVFIVCIVLNCVCK